MILDIKYWSRIPDDIIFYHIFPKISIKIMVWLNKENYLQHHNCIKDMISTTRYNNYIRDIIRIDGAFILERLISENLSNWLNPNKYFLYNNISFKDYLNYISYIITKYKADKCRCILFSHLKNSGIHKKWHKNNVVKNIRWII
jgi:hypothetical protein